MKLFVIVITIAFVLVVYSPVHCTVVGGGEKTDDGKTIENQLFTSETEEDSNLDLNGPPKIDNGDVKPVENDSTKDNSNQ